MATSNGLAVTQPDANSIMEDVIAKGDLGSLNDAQRVAYYLRTCESMGLNPLTKPFDYIVLNGKLRLYATRTATDQLRQARGVSITRIEAETSPDGLRIVTAYARDAAGREDSDLGAVNVKGLTGDALANAYMKALTKAKRRVTLSICGLGWMDESELETVPAARPVRVDHATGEILEGEAVVVEPTPPAEEPMTGPQKRKIWVMARDLGMTVEALHEFAGVDSLSDLTKAEASGLIDRLDQAIGAAMETMANAVAEQESMLAGNDPDRYTR